MEKAAAVGLISRTAAWVRSRMQGEGSHDWFHVERVWWLAQRLAAAEDGGTGRGPDPIDTLVVELSALLHDIADAKFHDGDETVAPRLARQWLEGEATDSLTPARIEQIVTIVATMSYRHGLDGFVPDPADREFAVVHDADRLDALGAIGIARCFAYGGAKGRSLYDPEQPPEQFATSEAYLRSGGSSLNHFYEKLFRLPEQMLTDAGRRLSEERKRYMDDYVTRFLAEWEGQA